MATTRLKRLKAVEVSYVPRGANRKRKFLALKEDDEMDVKKIQDLIAKMQLKNEAAVMKALEGLAPEDTDALKAALKVLQALGDKVKPETLQNIMGLVESPAAAPAQKAMDEMKTEKELAVAKAAKADAEIVVLKAEVAKLKATPITEVDGFPITKEGDLDAEKIPEALRPTIKALWSSKKAKDAEVAAIKKELSDERDIRVTKEYVEKATGFKHLAIKKEDLGKAMKAVALADPKAYEVFESVLKSCDEIVLKADPTSELGSSGGGADGSDFDAQIEAGTQAVMKEMRMDKATAMTHFITSKPEGRKIYADKRAAEKRASRN